MNCAMSFWAEDVLSYSNLGTWQAHTCSRESASMPYTRAVLFRIVFASSCCMYNVPHRKRLNNNNRATPLLCFIDWFVLPSWKSAYQVICSWMSTVCSIRVCCGRKHSSRSSVCQSSTTEHGSKVYECREKRPQNPPLQPTTWHLCQELWRPHGKKRFGNNGLNNLIMRHEWLLLIWLIVECFCLRFTSISLFDCIMC